jgi:hypothetical protein
MSGRLIGAIAFMLFLRLVVWCWPERKQSATVKAHRSTTHSPLKVLEGAYHLRS